LRRAVPKSGGLEVSGKFCDGLFVIELRCLLRIQVGDFRVTPISIKQPSQRPLLRCELVHKARTGRVHSYHWQSVFNMLTKGYFWIQPRRPLRHYARWNFGQGNVERSSKVHEL